MKIKAISKKAEKAAVITFPKLSEVKRISPPFCKCQECRLIFENDVHTMHAPCPKCGAVMENISILAAFNFKEKWDAEDKNQFAGFPHR